MKASRSTSRSKTPGIRRSRWSACLLVPVALLLASCGDADDSSNADDAGTATGTDVVDDTLDDVADRSSIDGHWILRGGRVDGQEIVLVDGWDVTLSLDGDRVDGTAACNGYGGMLTVDDRFDPEGSISIGALSWTEMGCEPSVMELEQQFLAGLSSVDSYKVTDTLSLENAGAATELAFERVAPVGERAVVGTTWRLDTLISLSWRRGRGTP